jgi:hypothetical protein
MQLPTPICRLFLPLILGGALLFVGCEGSEPREQVDETVKDLAGQQQVEQMDRMKKQLDAINQKQADRLKQFDETNDN